MSEQAAMWWVAHVIIVSAQGPNPSFFLFLGDFYSTWSLLGPGLGPGLDNFCLGCRSVMPFSSFFFHFVLTRGTLLSEHPFMFASFVWVGGWPPGFYCHLLGLGELGVPLQSHFPSPKHNSILCKVLREVS